jgi:predicted DNA-binding transcriptional regulator AlpA
MHRPRARIQASPAAWPPINHPISASASFIDPPLFLTPKETAAFLRLSEVTLARWRIDGTGPSYRKFGRRVVYAKADLLAWADGQTQQNTSQVQSCRPRSVK